MPLKWEKPNQSNENAADSQLTDKSSWWVRCLCILHWLTNDEKPYHIIKLRPFRLRITEFKFDRREIMKFLEKGLPTT